MAFKVEVEPRRHWYQRVWVWLLLAPLAFIFVSMFILAALERDQAEQASRAAASQVVPEVTLSCGGDKEYLRLPEVTKMVVIVEPTGKNCWTAWLRRPEKARAVRTDPDSDIDSEMAFGEGKIEKRHDSPLIEWSNGQVMNAVRYQNHGDKPVRITITANY